MVDAKACYDSAKCSAAKDWLRNSGYIAAYLLYSWVAGNFNKFPDDVKELFDEI